MKTKYKFIPYNKDRVGENEMLRKSEIFYKWMNTRRTVRIFSDKKIPERVLKNLIKTASTAPSGAHKQPWMFCLITDSELKKQIRIAAEKEEYENYHGRMPKEWIKDLEFLETDWHKEFLEIAPCLIVVFKKIFEMADGKKKNNYYVTESVGLATGFLLAAIHNAGLVALTHTPSPMNFLNSILKRPESERPFLLIPVGYPAENTMVPDLKRKSLKDVMVVFK